MKLSASKCEKPLNFPVKKCYIKWNLMLVVWVIV